MSVITAQGVEDVDKLLADYARRITKWTVIAPRVHDFLLVRESELFDSSGASEGMAWAGYDREPKYKAWKQAITGDLTPLRWKGSDGERLMPSLTNPNHPNHVFRTSSDAVTMGTSLGYAGRLHKGGRNMFGEPHPARKLVGLGDRSTSRLAQLIAIYITRGEARGNVWSR